jgi:hypothetical protein
MTHLLTAVQQVARAKAVGCDAEWLASKVSGPPGDVWQGRAWAGCERIARGLERDRIAVF